jgi:phosphomannomutase
MHGVGTATLSHVFQKSGYSSPILVTEQSDPDPDFPTVAFPNPEEPGAIDMALDYAKNFSADLVIANDPDADRCAIAANDPATGWRMLRGDELGTLFGYYIATTQDNSGKAFANSIVSSSALGKIAKKYGIDFAETLTGFKYISKIQNLAFGYEEAIGYCVDPNSVNDKDGISAAIKITECVANLKSSGIGLFEYLDQIWNEIGYHRTEQISIRVSDIKQTGNILERIRTNPPKQIAGLQVLRIEDLLKPTTGLLPTNGLRLWLEEEVRIIIRPSGTEPKLKCYIEVVRQTGSTSDKALADMKIASLKRELIELLK